MEAHRVAGWVLAVVAVVPLAYGAMQLASIEPVACDRIPCPEVDSTAADQAMLSGLAFLLLGVVLLIVAAAIGGAWWRNVEGEDAKPPQRQG